MCEGGGEASEVEDFHRRRLTARFDENVKIESKQKSCAKKGKTAVTSQESEVKRRKSAVVCEVSLSVSVAHHEQ